MDRQKYDRTLLNLVTEQCNLKFIRDTGKTGEYIIILL